MYRIERIMVSEMFKKKKSLFRQKEYNNTELLEKINGDGKTRISA